MTKTGSPVKNITTTVGPSYEEIYKKGYLKFELSNTTLRKTDYNKKKKRNEETLFFKVSDLKTIKKLKDRSVRWEPLARDENSRYYFREQQDAKGRALGCIKMIKKSKINANNPKDWLYFESRESAKSRGGL